MGDLCGYGCQTGTNGLPAVNGWTTGKYGGVWPVGEFRGWKWAIYYPCSTRQRAFKDACKIWGAGGSNRLLWLDLFLQ